MQISNPDMLTRIKNYLKLLVPPIVPFLYNRLMPQRAENGSTYAIGNVVLDMPENHDLPKFQKAWRLYDRFLPVLGRHLNPGQLIVDVGANVGDTAIALMQVCSNPVLCIEPSDVFYPYLVKNLARAEEGSEKRTRIVKALIGTGLLTGVLEHTKGGTAQIVKQEGAIGSFVALDEVIDDRSGVQLIKVDTDGFDFDVLKSGIRTIGESHPILYWENFVKEEFQLNAYNELYAELSSIGYSHLWLFDNFGNLVTPARGFETLKNLNAYIYSMEKFKCTRTLHYTDILACTDKHTAAVEQAVEEFKLSWINATMALKP